MSEMKKIKILFPQIIIEQKEVEVTEEKYDTLIYDNVDVVDFIWDNMTEQEQQWTNGKQWIESAIDCGYAGLKKIGVDYSNVKIDQS
jgi:hypothetical protein